MVFQYPEHQLFAETIYEDIAFGPRNQKKSEDEVEASVRRAMAFVDLDFDTFSQRSPFQLSGGQMRRVAIAGVVAMEPDYLIMDEPSAGLDPVSRDNIFSQLMKIFEKRQMGDHSHYPFHGGSGPVRQPRPCHERRQTSFGRAQPRYLYNGRKDPPETFHGCAGKRQAAQELRENGLPLEGTPLTKKELIRAIQKQRGGRYADRNYVGTVLSRVVAHPSP